MFDAPCNGAAGEAVSETVTFRWAGRDRAASWLSPSSPAPERLGEGDDRTVASAALARVRRGECLVYTGDFRNARQLLAAMGRRLSSRSGGRGDPGALYRAEREQRALEHTLLGRVLVPIEDGFAVPLRHAPDAAAALAEALSPAPGLPGLLPLRELLGMIGAHEWRRKGVRVAALEASVHPHYGVYAPVRQEYVDLVAAAVGEWPVRGKRAVDVGTGTGVLAFVLARAGARVLATDLEPRAVACAKENAGRLGLEGAVEVVRADLFPEGRFDLAISNPPWLPDDARSPLERAIYDPGGAFLARLVAGLPERLEDGGEAWIVLSDLAELVGLRPPGHLERLASSAGLRVLDLRTARPAHPRSRDERDPLHDVRAREVTRLYRLVRG
jgi:methylase of polypeptide subunit release factors